MKSLIAFFLMSSFTLAQAGTLKLDDIKDRNFSDQTASLYKNKSGNYELRIISSSESSDRSYLSREVIIPVKVNLEINGIDKSVQYGGISDSDAKSGTFSNLEGKKIESLFEEFEGTSFNVGILVIGGGSSKGRNRDNINFNDTNVSMIIGPSGSTGLNIGLSDFSYKLKITPSAKTVAVKYDARTAKNQSSQLSIIESIDEVRAISLDKE